MATQAKESLYKKNLQDLASVVNWIDAPREFDQSSWRHCLGHIAAMNRIGGLRIELGVPVIMEDDHNVVKDYGDAIEHVFGIDACRAIFVNDDYNESSFSFMKIALNDYIQRVYGATKKVDQVDNSVTMSKEQIASLFTVLNDIQYQGSTVTKMVIKANGDFDVTTETITTYKGS
jgi:hypothetical protein